ncbi:MAG: hypothetical protein ONB23_00690 [candidate division KSB1 bacterium]|nr:hypothetical protein [candidate division KSB1 bacterium]
MEILLLIAILSLVLLVKILFSVLRVGFYVLMLPLKILVGMVGLMLTLFLVLPLAIMAGLVSLVLSPALLLIPFLPFLMIALGLVLVLRSILVKKRGPA